MNVLQLMFAPAAVSAATWFGGGDTRVGERDSQVLGAGGRFAAVGLGTYSRCRSLAGGDMQRRETCKVSACSAATLDAAQASGLLWAKNPNDLLRRVRR